MRDPMPHLHAIRAPISVIKESYRLRPESISYIEYPHFCRTFSGYIVPVARKLNHLKVAFKYRQLRPYIDSAFYNAAYPDVASQHVDPLVHYLLDGWQEGRDPSPWFSTTSYLALHRDVAEAGINPLLHYIRHGRKEGRRLNPKSKSIPFRPENGVDHVGAICRYILLRHGANDVPQGGSDIHSCVKKVISNRTASLDPDPILPVDGSALTLHMSAIHPLFDRDYYLENNPGLIDSGIDPLEHYCTVGWKDLLKPNPNFDPWWYWCEYLNPKYELIDPLLHYAIAGREAGFKTRLDRPAVRHDKGVSYSNDQKISRICLFAGYDPHGIVDDYVIDYLRELSKFADIFYLADCRMQPGEIDKLHGIVKQAWHFRHGEYDFGSYARLARDLVGWQTIGDYDELIFANDSGYLVRTLDHVFQKMDALTTDWWGLQATKGLHDTRLKERNRYPVAIPMEIIKNNYLEDFEKDYIYNFFIGSYFTVYRKNITNDFYFQDYINNISKQETKLQIILKYEIGIFRILKWRGYKFQTFLDYLYPIHPIYSEIAFDLIKNGFPILKRLIFSENHYYVENLELWKEKIACSAPDANINTIEKNVLRTSDSEKLHMNFSVRRDASFNPIYPPLLSDTEMAELDAVTPKHDNWWAFPVCAYDHSFASNERAVFETVRYDPGIKKIILTRSRHVALDGENVEIYPLKSPEGQQALLRSRVIFIKHTPTSNVIYPISGEHHYFINLWHGIPLKRIGYASRDTAQTRGLLVREHEKLTATISSSKIDTMAMAAGFYPQSYNDIWMTGLPRHDFITREFDCLPTDLQEEQRHIQNILNGRHLILFCPTFRNGENNTGYTLTDNEKNRLQKWLIDNNAALGIREHMADRHKAYSQQIQGDNIIDISSLRCSNIEILYRVSSCLITDYSSCFIDYMLTGKHEISLAYDLDSYENDERGTFYDLDFSFPGDICQNFENVIDALDRAASRDFLNGDPNYAWKKRLFFEFSDDENSNRVVTKVKQLLGWSIE